MNNQIEKIRLTKGIKDQNTHHQFFPMSLNLRTDKDMVAIKVPSKKKNKMIWIICERNCNNIENIPKSMKAIAREKDKCLATDRAA